MRDDLIDYAKTDTPTGLEIREIFKNISLVDSYFMTFKEYTDRTVKRRDSDEPEVTDWRDFYVHDDEDD